MATTTCKLKWLKSLLFCLCVPHNRLMRLYCDRQVALHIAADPVFDERTKHIEIDCHFFRDEVQSSIIQTSYIHTNNQLTDIFTKVLGNHNFLTLQVRRS